MRAGVLVALLSLSLSATGGGTEDLVRRWDNPPRVTIKEGKIRVDEAVDRIRKATGQQVVVGANGSQAITLDLKDATFFGALEEVAQRSGLVLVGVPGAGGDEDDAAGSLRLERMPEEMKRLPPVVSGPVRISVVGVYAQRNASRLFSPEASEADDKPRHLWIGMRVLVEGGLDGVVVRELRIEHAPDDSDRNLAGATSTAKGPALGENLRIDLEAAASSALLVRALSGSAVFLVPEETTVLKFTQASRNLTKKLGNAKFTFKRLDRKGEDGKPEMAVLLEGNPCPESGAEDTSSWGSVRIMTNRWSFSRGERPLVGIYLYSRTDQPIGASSSAFGFSADDRECRFTLDEVPARIEVRAVTKVQKREIPFRFAELPIPR